MLTGLLTIIVGYSKTRCCAHPDGPEPRLPTRLQWTTFNQKHDGDHQGICLVLVSIGQCQPRGQWFRRRASEGSEHLAKIILVKGRRILLLSSYAAFLRTNTHANNFMLSFGRLFNFSWRKNYKIVLSDMLNVTELSQKCMIHKILIPFSVSAILHCSYQVCDNHTHLKIKDRQRSWLTGTSLRNLLKSIPNKCKQVWEIINWICHKKVNFSFKWKPHTPAASELS